jgi:hypothetical protein
MLEVTAMRMSKSKIEQKLDDIELKLPPLQWAIRLVNEMRKYSTDAAFDRARAKGQYREDPYFKPIFALSEQARRKFPDDIRDWSNECNRLRSEFAGLKILIILANREAQAKANSARLEVSALATRLESLVLREIVDLSGGSPTRIAGATGDRAIGSPKCLFFTARDVADDLAAVLSDLLLVQATIEQLQADYFRGQPILSLENDRVLESTKETILELIAKFDDYILIKVQSQERTGAAAAPGTVRWNSLIFDLGSMRKVASFIARHREYPNWLSAARFKARLQILTETSDHEEFFWNAFRAANADKPVQKTPAQ